MLYLSAFYFPDEDLEWEFRMGIKLTAYQSVYPFYVLPQKGLKEIFFKPVTILYGGNGCGKSTVLNVIAEKLRLKRASHFNSSPFFGDYVDMCRCSLDDTVPQGSRIVTSDDVFDFMLNVRALNEGVELKRDEALNEYFKLRDAGDFKLKSLEDYDRLRRTVDARRMTASRFVKQSAGDNVREHSNGESSELYFRENIAEDTLCLLDEPENSLSPENQMKLAEYIADSVRFCGNQFIISTHSPFLLALEGARIINMDDGCKTARSWTELPGARVYYEFFRRNAALFKA